VNTPDGSRTLIGAVQGDVFYKEKDGPQRKNSFFTKNGGYDNGEYGSGKDRGIYIYSSIYEYIHIHTCIYINIRMCTCVYIYIHHI
jgi:hypothetical protein